MWIFVVLVMGVGLAVLAFYLWGVRLVAEEQRGRAAADPEKERATAFHRYLGDQNMARWFSRHEQQSKMLSCRLCGGTGKVTAVTMHRTPGNPQNGYQDMYVEREISRKCDKCKGKGKALQTFFVERPDLGPGAAVGTHEPRIPSELHGVWADANSTLRIYHWGWLEAEMPSGKWWGEANVSNGVLTWRARFGKEIHYDWKVSGETLTLQDRSSRDSFDLTRVTDTP